eukprot:CAMPEP_0114244978 /NCGR_PEP_ID=MMETSP0058-20121206/11637_1 /TAXON_ID=36894 /ORGANISM="Pyramimonas parkeae, CCMP726" /LENGTH=262 /DNA_ID=CAMNT_0001357973 /DNA_START=181 /DNA_END=969 /DNA_ORIENTATION=+
MPSQPRNVLVEREGLPLVTCQKAVANRVRYQSQLHEMGGQDQYLATMNHWSTSLPRRLPGLEFVTLNALCTEPGVLVMRWRAQWTAPPFWRALRDVHGAWHNVLYGAPRNDEPQDDERNSYVVYGSSQLSTDEDGRVRVHSDTIDFEPEGDPNDRAWALFDFCMAQRVQEVSPVVWGWMVFKLFIYESLKDVDDVGDELKAMSVEERDVSLTQAILLQVLVTAVAAAVTAFLIIQFKLSVLNVADILVPEDEATMSAMFPPL